MQAFNQAFILTPRIFTSRGAAQRRRRFFFGLGTPWTRVFRQAGHTPPHQRFGRGDENYLVGEPVWRLSVPSEQMGPHGSHLAQVAAGVERVRR